MKKCLLFFLCAAIGLIACSSSKPPEKNNQPEVITTPSGLKYTELKTGSGPMPLPGQTVSVHQVVRDSKGNLLEDTYKNGLPFEFILGKDETIQGLEEGVMTMKVGGKRKLYVPPELGFGRRAVRTIPKNADLVIEVELIDIK